MAWLVTGTLFLVVPGLWAMRRARREFDGQRRLSVRTAALAFVAYVGHAVVTVLAALAGAGGLAVDRLLAGSAGVILLACGGLLYFAGRAAFGSFRRTWGLDCERLVTHGIYRYSRHPQSIGSIFVLAGTGLVGGSSVALLLAAELLLAAMLWLPIEERFLARRFGEDYRRYRRTTATLIGIPGRRSQAR